MRAARHARRPPCAPPAAGLGSADVTYSAVGRLGSVGDTTKHVNENQLVELANGSVLLGARSPLR